MPARIPGRADTRETQAYAQAKAPSGQDGYREAFGLTLSSIGLGTYLGEVGKERDLGYHEAVRQAVAGGINVLDTAINYRHQRSERVVGQALREAFEAGDVVREAVFVSTKGGFIPFDADTPDMRAAIHARYVEPGLIHEGNVVGGAHCIDPAFLDDQVRQSRDNLGLDTLDLYYVHNPESQLDAVGHDDLIERLRAAFVALEHQVDAGAVARYGIATWNGLRVPPGEPGHLSLAAVVDAAEAAREEVGDGPHHLAAVQAPLNLAMTEAVARPTQALPDGKVVPLAEACDHFGLAFFTSGSILQGRLARDIPDEVVAQVGDVGTHAQVALQATRSAPGVTTALVGMSSRSHVEEALGLLRTHPPGSGSLWSTTMAQRT